MSKLRYKEGGIWKSIAPSQKEFDDNVAAVSQQLAETTEQIQDIWLDVVRDFGADPTGLTLSQTAFDSALSTGRKIYIPSGIFLLNIFKVSNDNTEVLASEGATIKANQIVNGFLSIESSNVTIDKNLTVDGNNKATTGLRVKAGKKNVTIRCKVQNIYSADFMSRGIHIEGLTDNINLDGCKIDNIASLPNGIEGDNMGTARGIAIAPSTFVNGLPAEGKPLNITIKNCRITNITSREDGDGIAVYGWDNENVNVVIEKNYFNYCAKRALKITCAGVQITDNIIDNPYIGAIGGNYQDCMFAFMSIFGSDVLVSRNKMNGGNSQLGIEVGSSTIVTKGIRLKDNLIELAVNGIRTSFGLISLMGNTEDFEAIGNKLVNGNRGFYVRNRLVNALIANNTIKNASEKGMWFDSFNLVEISGVNIVGNKIFAVQYGIQLSAGVFIVTGNDGITGWEFITGTPLSSDFILSGNKEDFYPSLPTPKAFYAGKTVSLKGDVTNPTRFYMCVKLANSTSHEWKLLNFI